MAGKKDPRDDRPNPKHRAHDAACLSVPPFAALIADRFKGGVQTFRENKGD
jgi:hypothetical protein